MMNQSSISISISTSECLICPLIYTISRLNKTRILPPGRLDFDSPKYFPSRTAPATNCYLDIFDTTWDNLFHINSGVVQTLLVQICWNCSSNCFTTHIICHLFSGVRLCWKHSTLMKWCVWWRSWTIWWCDQGCWYNWSVAWVAWRMRTVSSVGGAFASNKIPQGVVPSQATCYRKNIHTETIEQL